MSKEELDMPMQVPLYELLASVPANAVLVVEDADGLGTRYIPVGRYCHEASIPLKQAFDQLEPEPVIDKSAAIRIATSLGWTPQRKPLTPQSPCEMTQAEYKMFKLGWLECEAAHGIKGET